MRPHASEITYFLVLQICGVLTHLYAEDAALIARGEHRIEIERYGRENPEVSIDILQSIFYNDNHEEFVVRIEDLNKTLNTQINTDMAREYNTWFQDEFDRRFSQYAEQHPQPVTTPANGNGAGPEAEPAGESESEFKEY